VRIIPIPFASDNLAYAVFDESNDSFVLVDPGDAAAVRCALRLVSRTATVAAVLATHHHWDHSAGNASFRALLNLGAFSAPRVDVFGSRVDFPVNGFVNAGWHRVNRHLEDRETFQIGRLLFRALLAPCHTRGHLIYILEGVAPSDSPVKSFKPSVFTGDAFFVGGCGRFFEGSGNDMHTVVQKCIDAIPEEALMWPGHEYSFSNLKFAVTIEPGNSKLQ
ncbi:beta-lactamase-like protein, partial [Chytriomyces sp. MP71]